MDTPHIHRFFSQARSISLSGSESMISRGNFLSFLQEHPQKKQAVSRRTKTIMDPFIAHAHDHRLTKEEKDVIRLRLQTFMMAHPAEAALKRRPQPTAVRDRLHGVNLLERVRPFFLSPLVTA